jgi:nucleoid DNA-binding protein
VDEIAQRTGLTKKDVADTVDEFLEAVSRALVQGKHIEIRGFGTFKVKDRKPRTARNPRTGTGALLRGACPSSKSRRVKARINHGQVGSRSVASEGMGLFTPEG